MMEKGEYCISLSYNLYYYQTSIFFFPEKLKNTVFKELQFFSQPVSTNVECKNDVKMSF